MSSWLSPSFFCALILWIVPSAHAREFVVLANPQAPFKYEINGQISGIDVEVLDLVMGRLGLTYRIKLIESGARLMREIKMGRADMLLLLSKNKARMEFLVYPEESYIDLTWNFFIRREDRDRIKYRTFDDLHGLIVGATKSYAYTPEFWNAGLALKILPYNSLQLKMLLRKRTDIVALNTINTLFEQKDTGLLDKVTYLSKPLKTKPYYNVFSRSSDHPDMARLQDNYSAIIRELKKDGTIERIFRKYLGHQ